MRSGLPPVPRGATINEAARHCVDRHFALETASPKHRLAYYRSLLAALAARSMDAELSDPCRRTWFEQFRDVVVTAIANIERAATEIPGAT